MAETHQRPPPGPASVAVLGTLRLPFLVLTPACVSPARPVLAGRVLAVAALALSIAVGAYFLVQRGVALLPLGLLGLLTPLPALPTTRGVARHADEQERLIPYMAWRRTWASISLRRC